MANFSFFYYKLVKYRIKKISQTFYPKSLHSNKKDNLRKGANGMRFERSAWYLTKLNTELEMETGRSGYRSDRDSSTGRSSRLKHRSYSPFLQLKDI